MRAPIPTILVTLAVISLASAATVAQRRGPETMSVDELRPGMRGYGLTVFRGTEPERFDVEVIDVLRGFRPGQELILVRTPHPLLNRARVVGGMSGSPIYIDGKLIGAYAYGWPNASDPVIGVTPIANMLAELYRPVLPDAFPGARPFAPRPHVPVTPPPDQASQASRARVAPSLPLLFPAEGEAGPLPDALTALAAHTESLRQDSPLGLVPTSTPVMLGGFTDAVSQLLARELGPLGLSPMQAGGVGSARREGPRSELRAGGAMAVSLVRGDMSTSAIGTVTHVDPGGRFVGFGHPMLNQGQVGLPAAAARILHVFVSNERSMKIGEALDTVGTLVHDRQSGVVVDTGLEPATVPMKIRLRGIPGAPKERWEVELASHRAFTPMLAYASIENAIAASVSDRLPVRWTATSRVTLEGYGDVTVTDFGGSAAGPGVATPFRSLRLFALIEAAFANPFTPSRVTDIEVDIAFEFGHHNAEVLSASIPDRVADPGETVPVEVVLRRYGVPDERRVFPVTIPAEAAGETVKLRVRPAPAVPRERGQARSLEQLVSFVTEAPPATSLAISVERKARGMRFPGRTVGALPASAALALEQVNNTEAGQAFTLHEDAYFAVGDIVGGSAELELEVREQPRVY